uniref:gliding motility-associated C-terminal domain-containing protein n=2 Tax=Flavobacterium sp. TaxID=239 RepID=UPI0040474176
GLEISLDGGAYGSTTTFNGLSSGSHTICVRKTSDPTCTNCSAVFTINPVATAPNTPTLSITQPTCAVNSGSAAITSTTTGLEISLDGGAYGSTTTFNGLSSGSHTICVRNTSDSSCFTCESFTINPVATAPNTPTLSIIQPTCAVNSGSVAITSSTTGLEISLDGGAYGSTTTFNGLSSGSHTICVRNSSDPTCTNCSAVFTINPVATAPSVPTLSITQPTCAVNSGSVAITSSTISLQISSDGGAYGSTTTFNGLSSGQHTICVRNTSDPTCFTCESFTINPVAIAPSAPTLSITQPTCAVNSGSVAITSTTTGLQISLDNGTYGTAISFSSLSSGSHTICVRNTSDPSCFTCESFTINPVATAPNTPTLNITQPTCAVNSGSVSITSITTGLEISLDGGAYGNVTTFNGLSSGQHTICVRNTSDPTCFTCESFTINPVAIAPSAPTLSITQPTCAVNSGSVAITSTTTGLEISLDNGTYGTAISFSSLSSGSHTICVRNTSDASCFTCETFTVNPVATAPNAPTLNVIQPTCAVNSGSVSITSSVAGLEISLDNGTYGTAISFSSLSSGSHTICVRNTSDPSCMSCNMFSINASICAEDDIFLLQACTPFIATVLDNDTLDGNYITDISLVLLNAVTQNGITIQTDGSITLDSTVVPGTYTLQYNLCEAQNPSNCDTATLTIEITPSEIKIFNNVTANNDNINDYLMVEGVTFYPDNTMQIFNRWGTLVYEENGYNNLDKRFEGRSTAHLTINASEGLPVGTYYYIFKYVDCHNQPVVKNGYLYINR